MVGYTSFSLNYVVKNTFFIFHLILILVYIIFPYILLYYMQFLKKENNYNKGW